MTLKEKMELNSYKKGDIIAVEVSVIKDPTYWELIDMNGEFGLTLINGKASGMSVGKFGGTNRRESIKLGGKASPYEWVGFNTGNSKTVMNGTIYDYQNIDMAEKNYAAGYHVSFYRYKG